MIFMFLSNNPSSGDIKSSNLSCWLINHWTNEVQTGLTSLDRHFDSHDIIYHVRP